MRPGDTLAHQAPCHFQGVEGVPAGDLVEPNEEWTRHICLEAAAKHYEAVGLGEDYVKQFIR